MVLLCLAVPLSGPLENPIHPGKVGKNANGDRLVQSSIVVCVTKGDGNIECRPGDPGDAVHAGPLR